MTQTLNLQDVTMAATIAMMVFSCRQFPLDQFRLGLFRCHLTCRATLSSWGLCLLLVGRGCTVGHVLVRKMVAQDVGVFLVLFQSISRRGIGSGCPDRTGFCGLVRTVIALRV